MVHKKKHQPYRMAGVFWPYLLTKPKKYGIPATETTAHQRRIATNHSVSGWGYETMNALNIQMIEGDADRAAQFFTEDRKVDVAAIEMVPHMGDYFEAVALALTHCDFRAAWVTIEGLPEFQRVLLIGELGWSTAILVDSRPEHRGDLLIITEADRTRVPTAAEVKSGRQITLRQLVHDTYCSIRAALTQGLDVDHGDIDNRLVGDLVKRG